MNRHAYHRASPIYYDSVRLALYASIRAILSTVLQLLTFVGPSGSCERMGAVRRQKTHEISCPA